MAPFTAFQKLKSTAALGAATCVLELLLIGGICFGLEKVDLELVAAHTPPLIITLAPSFAVAAVLLRGLWIWPAVFAGFLAAPASAAMPALSVADWAVPLSVAGANALAALVAGSLITVWSDGRRSFETPAGVARFVAISLGPGAMLGATLATAALYLSGDVVAAELGFVLAKTWLRLSSGMLVVAPALVIWAPESFRRWKHEYGASDNPWVSAAALLATSAVGFFAFSPLLAFPLNRGAFGLLAVAPLVWAALNCTQRVTAVCTLILSAFAIWGGWPGDGPFGSNTDQALLISSIFVMGASVLGLALSADVVQRERIKAKLRFQEQNLRALLSHADVGLAQIDVAGRFTVVNARYCDIVRTSGPGLLALRIDKLIDSDNLYQMRELLAQAVHTGQPFTVESKTKLPDGTRVWIKSNIAPIFDQRGVIQYFAAVAEDVTAHRSAEEKLIREHQILQSTFDERTTALKKAREVLHAEMEQRKRVEAALKHDIAERRKTQEALMESEWRFRTVITGDHRLCHFHARPGWLHHKLEHGCATDPPICCGRDHRAALQLVLFRGGGTGGRARPRPPGRRI